MMQVTNPLQHILQVYGKQVTAGKEVMIGLTNGVVFYSQEESVKHRLSFG